MPMDEKERPAGAQEEISSGLAPEHPKVSHSIPPILPGQLQLTRALVQGAGLAEPRGAWSCQGVIRKG